MTEKVDAAIIGAGPAGAAAALRMRQHAPYLTVALLESAPRRPSVGETLPPPAQALLQGLGLWQRFVAQQHVASAGIVSSWGGVESASTDFITTPFGRGWHLDRPRFENLLVSAAADHGAIVLRRSRFRAATRSGGQWQLTLERDGRPTRLDAGVVIDATGRHAAFARMRGARRVRDDAMIAVCAVYQCPQGVADTRLQIEAVEHGWWYSAIVPGDLAMAVFMTDGDIAHQLHWSNPDAFGAALAATSLLADRFANATPLRPPRTVAAYSGCLDQVHGPGWIAAGDAAAAVDPLSGQGIAKSVLNGVHAAYAAADWVGGDRQALARYAARIDSAHAQYLDTKDTHYANERRWLAAPFWMRRQAELQLAPNTRIVRAPGQRQPRCPLRQRIAAAFSNVPRSAHAALHDVRASGRRSHSDRRLVLTLQALLSDGVVRIHDEF